MNSMYVRSAISLLVLAPVVLTAQVARERDLAPLKNWPAPLYWHPSVAEQRLGAPAASLPLGTNALVFVAMTPCRLVDTRTGQGFSGAFGPPSLAGNAPGRAFPIPSSTTCSIPSLAQAYSFNVTVVPGNSVGFITAYPAGQTQPLAATLVWQPNVVVSNAAIVAAGTGGSVDVYANAGTDLVVDINGYYAPPSDLQSNTALGTGALQNNTAGIGNTASGAEALNANTTGGNNTASGGDALQSNTAGGFNTASGANALFSNTTGNQNTANGSYALFRNSTGNSNTASGVNALYWNTNGNNNIAIGTSAAINVVSGGNSNNIHIGSQGDAADSGVIRIGDSASQSSFFAAGVRGITTGANNAIPVVVDSNGQLGTVSSSRRFKEDI